MSEVILQKLTRKKVILTSTDLVFIDYSMNDAGDDALDDSDI